MKRSLALAVLFLGLVSVLPAQKIPYHMPLNFKNAYDAGTRSMDGTPGPLYWQNRADYRIDVSLDPESRTVSGSETIRYFNNSPASLEYLVVQLLPDLYRKGGARDFDIDFNDASEGVLVEKMTLNGVEVVKNNKGRLMTPKATGMYIYLPDPLKPGDDLTVEVNWSYRLNEKSHYREGVVSKSAFFVAYFYPRIAVFDDIDGWNNWDYSGTAEFYNDFGNYEVTVEVPGDYIVRATGIWQNPGEILREAYLARYNRAATSDETVKIISKKDLPLKNIMKTEERHSWKFLAEHVTDFAFGAAGGYLWDATSLVVDSVSGRRIMVDAVYSPQSADFYHVADIAREGIKRMSYDFPAIPFPYPKITVFNGLSEMEYPMMVNDISLPDLTETIKLTVHEIFHTYFPFYTGLNETKYAWMDEGLTSYGESLIASKMDTTRYAGYYFLDDFEDFIGYDYDVPLFVCSEYLRKPVYYANSYPKAAAFFGILHGYLGNDEFLKALQEFTNRWKGKNPTPYDFIFTFEDVTGQDLSWLIRPWLFEFGYVDLALGGITKNGEHQVLTIEKSGLYPAPFMAEITYADGLVERYQQDAGIWKEGNSTYQLKLPQDSQIKSVKLKNITGMDADLSNNFFSARD